MLRDEATGRHPGKTLYGVLGVPPEASPECIVHAYRRQARCAHPDVRPGDPSAAARFRTLTSAYEVLSDPGRRADYDRSLRYLPRHDRPARTGVHEVGTRDPDVFLEAMPQPPSGAHLWAGPVRVECSPRDTSGEVRDHRAPRNREIDELASFLVRLLSEWWTQ
jgi:curved DNA-binding protein CbpA